MSKGDDLEVDYMQHLSGKHAAHLEEKAVDHRREKFLEQAFEAYSQKEYKQAIMMLRGIQLTDEKSVEIVTDCAYDFWRSVQPISTQGNHTSGWEDKTPDQLEAVDSVKNSFTQLFSSTLRDSIGVFQYIRLSHVYLTEAALSGALQILHLGQARGHLENILLVVQSWSIMKRMRGKVAECELCMKFLITAVQIENRDHLLLAGKHTEFNPAAVIGTIMVQDSDLPLAYVYLHCAAYLFRQSINAKLDEKGRTENRELCYNMLAEAYHITFNQQIEGIKEVMDWFQSFELFFDMALYLEATCFVMLAEECYWEAFLRKPLLDITLEYMVSLMAKHKRGQRKMVHQVIERAYNYNPWNMFVRNYLLDYEKTGMMQNPHYHPKHTKRFAYEALKAALIQGAMRGYLLRNKEWPKIYWRAKAKKDAWDEHCRVASIAHRKVVRLLHLDRFNRWRMYSTELHELRREASIKIQTCWRRVYGGIIYRRRLARAIRANGNFLVGAEFNYDNTRRRFLREWEALYRRKILNKSADTIRETLLANGFSAIFKEACEKIISIIKVKRKWSNHKIWQEWQLRYRVRQKRHAHCAIRFFIRGQIRRAREEQLRAKLEAREKVIAQLQEKSTAYIMPLKRFMWDNWRYELYLVRAARARIKVQRWVRRLVARQKAWQVYTLKRVKKEVEIAFTQTCLFNRVGSYLMRWRANRASLPLQRSIRCFVARQVAKRWKKIRAGMKKIRLRREKRSNKWIWFLWSKFIFLANRERHQASRKITIAFKKWLRLRYVTRATKRKLPARNLLIKMHLLVLRKAFKKMASGVTGLHTLLVLGPLFLSRWRQCVRMGFWRWKRVSIQQKRIEGLINLRIKRLEKHFWKDCHHAVVINPHLTYAKDELGPPGMVRSAYNMSWETELALPDPSLYLINDTDNMRKMVAFKVWLTSRRYRHRIVRNAQSSGALANRLIQRGIRHLFARQRSARNFQGLWRRYVAKKILWARTKKAERADEIYQKVVGRPKWRIFMFMQSQSQTLRKARITIQCWCRQYLARQVLHKRRVYLNTLERYLDIINKKSKSARSLLRKYTTLWQVLYIYNIAGITDEGGLNSIDVLRLRKQHKLYEEAQQHRLRQKDEKMLKHRVKRVHARNRNSSADLLSGELTSKSPLRKVPNKFGLAEELGGFGGYERSSLVMSKSTTSLGHKGRSILARGGANVMGMGMGDRQSSNMKFKSRNISYVPKDDFSVGSNVNSFDAGGTKGLQARKQVLQDMQSLATYENVSIYEMHEEQEYPLEMPGDYSNDKFMSMSLTAKMMNMTGPHSVAMHAHAYRLQQSGIFVYDPLFEELQQMELAFLVQSCSVLFIQNVTPYALKTTFNHFKGSKLVLCGGRVSQVDAIYLLSYIGERRANLALHFQDTSVGFGAVTALTQCVGEPSTNAAAMIHLLADGIKVVPPSLTCLSHLKELSIDTASVGPIGAANLIVAMSNNTSVETLIVKFTHKMCILPCYNKIFKLLAGNNYLKELRLFGESLTETAVEGLYQAVYHGLKCLSLLEFSCDDGGAEAATKLVNLAKDRLYAGRSGLSVTVL